MNPTNYHRVGMSISISFVLLFGLLLVLSSSTQGAQADTAHLFVIPSGSGDCSQANPCDLQTAHSAAGDGDNIYLATGTYTGVGAAVITVTHNTNLYGGWDGGMTNPPYLNPVAYPVTIDGESARRGVVVTGGNAVTLEGFSIANGMDTYQGAGLYALNTDLILRNMTVISNVIDIYDTPDTYAYGGGVMVEGGSLLMENSTFQNNSAWASSSALGGGLAISGTITATVTESVFQKNDAWDAGALYFYGNGASDPTLTIQNCIFTDNGWGLSGGRAHGGYAGAIEINRSRSYLENNSIYHNNAANDYGALAVSSSTLYLARNLISDNRSGRTSALYLSLGQPFTITNNIIANNVSSYNWLDNPAVRLLSGEGLMIHNTIANNDSTYGLLIGSSAVATLTNTILVSHTVGISVTAGGTASLENTLWGSGDWANAVDWGGAGSIITGTINLWGDPAFVDPDNGNYHIGSGSAAENTGIDAGIDVDIDGQSRPWPAAGNFDIGADEFVWWQIFQPLVWKDFQ